MVHNRANTKRESSMRAAKKEMKADAYLSTLHDLSVNTVAMMVNKHPRTIRYWFDNNRDLFEAALAYTKGNPGRMKEKYKEIMEASE